MDDSVEISRDDASLHFIESLRQFEIDRSSGFRSPAFAHGNCR
jgi:hypothetical protein